MIQMAAAGALALEAGAVVEAVHQIEISNVFSTLAGTSGLVGTMLLTVASAVGIYWFGWVPLGSIGYEGGAQGSGKAFR